MKQIISNKAGLHIKNSKNIAMKDITKSGEYNYVNREYMFKNFELCQKVEYIEELS